MAVKLPSFTHEEMAVEEVQGFPKAYALLCKTSTTICPFLQGPPFSFLPYTLKSQEALRFKELNQMFPIIDPEASPSSNLKSYATLLWDQLDHLGAAGFDPALFRVDAFGNVIYLHADSASPLAWDIDHWFPCSRGGKSVPSNLRILQWQVCREKKNKLDFLVPWWDLQLGVSVNQFLSTVYSANLDFRRRALAFLFPDVGGFDEANCSEATVVLTAVNLNRFCEKNHSSAEDLKNNSCVAASLRQINETRRKLRAEISELDEELDELKQKNDIERIALQELELALIRKRRRVEKCRRLSEAQGSYKSVLEKMIRDAMHQTVAYKEQLRLNQAASSALMARLEAQRAACDSSEKELRRKHKQRDELEMHAKKACFEQTRKRMRVNDELNEFSSHLSSTRRARRPAKKELRVFLEKEQKACELGISPSFSEEEEELEEKEEEAEIASFAEEDDDALPLNSKTKRFALEKNACTITNSKKMQILGTKDQELMTVNNKLKQRKHCELSVMNTKDFCRRIKGKKKQIAYRCDSSFNAEDEKDVILDGNMIKQTQKRDLDASQANESKNQWNLYEQEEENEEFLNRVGKGNVEKWLRILLENSKEDDASFPDSLQSQKKLDQLTNTTSTPIKNNEIDFEERLKEKRIAGTSCGWKVSSRRSRKSSKVWESEESKL